MGEELTEYNLSSPWAWCSKGHWEGVRVIQKWELDEWDDCYAFKRRYSRTEDIGGDRRKND
jgi:hypothetical protein